MNRVHVNADNWKIILQIRITTESHKPGAVVLYDDKNPKEHATIVKHWAAETLERSFEPGKGHREKMVAKSETNHYLDATAYSCAAGHYVGFRVRDPLKTKNKSKRAPRRSAVISGRNGKAFVASQR